jgi:hypothetical protein
MAGRPFGRDAPHSALGAAFCLGTFWANRNRLGACGDVLVLQSPHRRRPGSSGKWRIVRAVSRRQVCQLTLVVRQQFQLPAKRWLPPVSRPWLSASAGLSDSLNDPHPDGKVAVTLVHVGGHPAPVDPNILSAGRDVEDGASGDYVCEYGERQKHGESRWLVEHILPPETTRPRNLPSKRSREEDAPVTFRPVIPYLGAVVGRKIPACWQGCRYGFDQSFY